MTTADPASLEGIAMQQSNDFMTSYLDELRQRVARGKLVGFTRDKALYMAILYDHQDQKFVLVQAPDLADDPIVSDVIERERRGRKVLVFGLMSVASGFVAIGHAIVNPGCLQLHFIDARWARIQVDTTEPYLTTLLPPAIGQPIYDGAQLGHGGHSSLPTLFEEEYFSAADYLSLRVMSS